MVSDKKVDIRFGERLCLLRKADPSHLTQDGLAEIMSVSTRTVSTWETGERIPPVGVIAWLADYFEVSMDYLIGRTDWPVFERKDTEGNVLYVGSPEIPKSEFDEQLKDVTILSKQIKRNEQEFTGQERSEIREVLAYVRELKESRKKDSAG